jgi:hypothetical protein
MGVDQPGGAIDIDLLMSDLKARAQQRREAGEIDPRILDMPFSPEDDPSPRAPIHLRPEVAYSSKPGIGRLITLLKRTLIKLQFHFINDVVTQANAALARLDDQLRDERAARGAIEKRAMQLEDEIAELRRKVAGLETPADPAA